MNSFLHALQDGFVVLAENWQLLLVIASLIFVSQWVIQRLMRSIFADRLDGEEYFALGMGGWLFAACLLSLLWYVLRIHGGILIALTGILAVIFFFRSHAQMAPASKTTVVGFLLLLALSIPLRLAFTSGLVLPMYFDSTRHYTIVESILRGSGLSAPDMLFSSLTTDYYHVGFHLLAAFIASILDSSIASTILNLGQMILAVAPLSIFLLIKRATRSSSAGLFAVLLAGFGWSMPAYALNWGKYPAVTSIALLPFVLSLAYLTAQHRHDLSKPKKWMLYALAVSAVAVCAALHSRSLVVMALAVAAWIAAGWWQSLSTWIRRVLFIVLLLGILSIGSFLYRQEIFEPLFSPYLSQGLYVTLIVLLLSVFAPKEYPRWTFANLAVIFFIFCALFIPTSNMIPRLADRTLLDRPFVEMLLYLPLSLLGGLGVAGLAQTLQQARSHLRLRADYISVLFMTFLIAGAIWQYDFYPSPCCSIISRDDMQAMDWMRDHIPGDAHILIAADELMISSFESTEGYAPVDAGAWITPLTGRSTVPMLYSTNLDKAEKFASLCKLKVDYIYIGGVGLSFHAPRLQANPDWYKPVLSLSRVEVYQVIGCP